MSGRRLRAVRADYGGLRWSAVTSDGYPVEFILGTTTYEVGLLGRDTRTAPRYVAGFATRRALVDAANSRGDIIEPGTLSPREADALRNSTAD